MDTPPPFPLVPAPAPAPSGALDPAGPAARLLAAWLRGRSPATTRAYAGDLRQFAAFCGTPDPALAAGLLLARGQGAANELVLGYRAAMLEQGLAPATVNRRVAAVRSLVKLGRTLGIVPWTLEVDGARTEAYRDTKGPGRDGFRALLAQLEGRRDPRGLRDRACLRLLYDLGLRRAEVAGLDLEHYDRPAGTVAVLGKGKRERVKLSLPPPTAAALEAWVAARGAAPGPLFLSLGPGARGQRFTGSGLYRVVRGLGERAGVRARPHGLRHASISRLLDLTNGNVREVQRFSRHANVQTLLRYDDARRDDAAGLARRLAEDV